MLAVGSQRFALYSLSSSSEPASFDVASVDGRTAAVIEITTCADEGAVSDDDRWPDPLPLLALAFQFDCSGPSSAQTKRINDVASVKLASAG